MFRKRRVIVKLNRSPKPQIPSYLGNWTKREYEFDRLMQEYLNLTRRHDVWDVPAYPGNPDFMYYLRHGPLPFNIHEELYESWER